MKSFHFLNLATFGKLPKGERLEKIRRSPNYRNGQFQNQSETPDLTEGATYFSVLKEFLFGKSKRIAPKAAIPSVFTNLVNLDLGEDVLVWFGHSSYFMQLDGKRILVDPVLSGHASPFSFTTKAFKGSDRYTAEDLPEIDYLFISHDHYDHLDYKTVVKLRPRIGKVICGLGTGEHFESWGYGKDQILEMDWHHQQALDDGFLVHSVPARHFSGRGLKRNQALWTSFVLQSPTMQIFIGGDSGYDAHFQHIGKTFGSFDLAILENGQYDRSWKHIHLMPDEILTAAKELNASVLFPVHSSKFVLANHSWDEPLELLVNNGARDSITILTPMIGEKVDLRELTRKFSSWWRSVE